MLGARTHHPPIHTYTHPPIHTYTHTHPSVDARTPTHPHPHPHPHQIVDGNFENFNYAGIVTRLLQPILPVFFTVQFAFLYDGWRNEVRSADAREGKREGKG